MNTPDALNEHLIRLLAKDAGQSSKALAKQLNISSATIRRRIRSLIYDKIVRIVAIVDPYKVGFGLIAVIALNVDASDTDSVVEKLGSCQQIKWSLNGGVP